MLKAARLSRLAAMDITKFTTGPKLMTAKTVTEGEYKIEGAEIQSEGEGEKKKEHVLLSFSNDSRVLKLHPAQVTELARKFGKDTDEWKGKAVRLMRGEDGKGVLLLARV